VRKMGVRFCYCGFEGRVGDVLRSVAVGLVGMGVARVLEWVAVSITSVGFGRGTQR
jgi:hypothetical protein